MPSHRAALAPLGSPALRVSSPHSHHPSFFPSTGWKQKDAFLFLRPRHPPGPSPTPFPHPRSSFTSASSSALSDAYVHRISQVLTPACVPPKPLGSTRGSTLGAATSFPRHFPESFLLPHLSPGRCIVPLSPSFPSAGLLPPLVGPSFALLLHQTPLPPSFRTPRLPIRLLSSFFSSFARLRGASLLSSPLSYVSPFWSLAYPPRPHPRQINEAAPVGGGRRRRRESQASERSPFLPPGERTRPRDATAASPSFLAVRCATSPWLVGNLRADRARQQSTVEANNRRDDATKGTESARQREGGEHSRRRKANREDEREQETVRLPHASAFAYARTGFLFLAVGGALQDSSGREPEEAHARMRYRGVLETKDTDEKARAQTSRLPERVPRALSPAPGTGPVSERCMASRAVAKSSNAKQGAETEKAGELDVNRKGQNRVGSGMRWGSNGQKPVPGDSRDRRDRRERNRRGSEAASRCLKEAWGRRRWETRRKRMEERRKSACAREQHRQSVKAGDISRPYVRLSASQGSRSSAFSGRLSPSVSAVSAGGRASFSPSASQFRGGFPLFFIPAGRGPAAASQAFGDAADAYFLRHLGTDASVEGEERAVSPVTESSPVRCLSSAPPVGTPESEEEHFLLHLEAEGAGAATPETATDPQEAATSVELRDSKDEGQRQTLTEKLRWTWLLTWKVLQLFAVALPLAICAGVVVLALSGVRHVWGAEETPEGPSDTRRPGRETVQETLERALFQMIGAAASAAGPTYVKCLQWAGTRRDLFPTSFCNFCAAFQRQPADGAFAFPHVALLLKSRFGDNWKEELLLDPKPVGSGCIAVVFRGLLRLHVHPDDPTHRRFLSQAFYAFDAPPEDSGPAPPEPATHAQTAGAGAVAVAGTCAGLAAAPGAAGALGSTVSSGALGSTVSSGAAPGVAGALAVGAAALAAEGATKLSEAAVSETQAEDSGGEQRCGKAGGKGERASVAPTRRHCPGLEREDTSSDRVEWSRTDSDGGERKKAGAGPRESDAGSRGVQGSPTEETLWMCVAVKAVKPGTRDSMSADLVILQTLAKIVESLPGMQWLNLSPGAAEFAETMQNQLNLETEARNLLRFRRDFDLPSPSFPSSLSPLSSSSSPPAISTSSSSPSSSSSSPSSSSSSPSSSSSSPSSSSSSISPSSPPSSSLFSPLFLWMASLLPSMPVSDAAPSAPPGVSFPLPVLPLCAPDLLVMTLEEGLPLDLLLRFANERQREKTRAAHTASAGESLPAPRAGRFAAVSASKGTRAKDAHDRKREFDREGRPGTAGDGERERLEQGQGDSVRQDQRREEATGRGDGDAETDAGTSFEAELVRAAKLASRQVDENRERIGLATLHAFLKMLLLNNFLHADLHPGNVLLRRGRSLLPLEPPALHAPCPAEPEDGGAEGSSAGRVGQSRESLSRRARASIPLIPLARVATCTNQGCSQVPTQSPSSTAFSPPLSTSDSAVSSGLAGEGESRRLRIRASGFAPQLQLVFLDSGLAASLDGPDFENFLLLLKAVALARGEQAGRLLVERARRKLADSDAEAFIRAVSDVVKKYHYQDGEGFFLAAAQLGEVFSKMFELSRQHRVVLDSQFANVFLAISILEGVGKQLDPNVDILKTALPYTIQAVKKLYLSKRGRVARGARENVSDEAS